MQRLWPLPQDERHQPAPHQASAPAGKRVPRPQKCVSLGGGGDCISLLSALGFNAPTLVGNVRVFNFEFQVVFKRRCSLRLGGWV